MTAGAVRWATLQASKRAADLPLPFANSAARAARAARARPLAHSYAAQARLIRVISTSSSTLGQSLDATSQCQSIAEGLRSDLQGASLAWASRRYDRESGPAGFFTPTGPNYDGEHSSSHSSSKKRSDGSPQRVSDHEYGVRVGRAYDLLRATLPEFMRTGLVDYDDRQGKNMHSSSGITLLDVLAFRNLRAKAEELARHGDPASSSSSSNSRQQDMDDITSISEQVYHPAIHFRFCANNYATPSDARLTDEEAASMSFSGRSLYFASAHILRQSLNIIFGDATVVIENIRRERKGKMGHECVSSSGFSMPPPTPKEGNEGGAGSSQSDRKESSLSSRKESIYVRIGFLGHLRVTGAEHRYTLVFRYEFDEDSGRIVRHTVERIEPAIGRNLWSGLSAVWARITGQQQAHPLPSAVPVHLVTRAIRERYMSSAVDSARRSEDRVSKSEVK